MFVSLLACLLTCIICFSEHSVIEVGRSVDWIDSMVTRVELYHIIAFNP